MKRPWSSTTPTGWTASGPASPTGWKPIMAWAGARPSTRTSPCTGYTGLRPFGPHEEHSTASARQANAAGRRLAVNQEIVKSVEAWQGSFGAEDGRPTQAGAAVQQILGVCGGCCLPAIRRNTGEGLAGGRYDSGRQVESRSCLSYR